MHTLVKKSLSVFFVLTLIFSPLAGPLLAPKAEAQMGGVIAGCLGGYIASLIGKFLSFTHVPVDDTKNNIKECIDAIAFALAKTLLAELTDSIINWINEGFEGNPFYIGDTGNFFAQAIEDELQLTLDELQRTGTIFFDIIRQNAIYEIRSTLHDKFEFSLDTDIIRGLCGYAEYENEEFCTEQLTPETRYELSRAFTGGYIPFQWSTWDSLTQNCANNIFCVNTSAINYKLAQEQTRIQELNDDLNRGAGFLSQKVCRDPGYKDAKADWEEEMASYTTDGDTSGIDPETLPPKPICADEIIQTPGRIIADKLTSNLGTSERQLELADELNESLAAIFNALIEKLINDGLKSFSSRGSDDDNDAYYSRLSGGNSGFEYESTNSSLGQDSEACEFAGGVYDEELEVCDLDAVPVTPGGQPEFPFTLTDGTVIEDAQDLASLINANPGTCIQIDEIRIIEGSEPCITGVSDGGGEDGGGEGTLEISPDPLVVGSTATFTLSDLPANTDFEIAYIISGGTDLEFLTTGVTEADGTGVASVEIPTITATEIIITVDFGGELIEQTVQVSQ